MDGRLLFLSLVFIIGVNGRSKYLPADVEPVVKDEYLVVLKTGADISAVSGVLQASIRNGVHVQQKYVIGKNTILRVRGALDKIEKLSEEDAIRIIEPNRLVELERPIQESLPAQAKAKIGPKTK